MDFMLKPRFTNNVPDVPFDAKFMPCPFVPLSRFLLDFLEKIFPKKIFFNKKLNF